MFAELVYRMGEAEAEALGDAMLEAGALSVTVEDADLDTDAETPIFGEPGLEPEVAAWTNNLLVALIDAGESAEHAALALEQKLAEIWEGSQPVREAIRLVDDQDWVRATQAQFDPIGIGRLWVVPSWHQPPEGAEVVMTLDPGMAFGTGGHPTTRLCLEWLERELPAGARVLDYGCGSGILAIAAKLLGAGETEGLDIDPNAVIAARDNAGRNNVEARFHDAETSVSAGGFDVVVANILSNPLKVLAPALVAQVKAGGALVLSGVLERQALDVAAVYAECGLPVEVAATLDGWVCLAGRRPA
ncbi:50S ribosomal protein L11 methyltransferase [Derxia gummosa]|uniref:Ribosomal protein L11 methyltransferase n=1 Tax=Derxia gummosa DSM 723 TaxID=1121388 RepID=A0A8B6X8V5_9BURK|nr:50S ribosomal protein L11 methyltransferase [Derxia gummosa]